MSGERDEVLLVDRPRIEDADVGPPGFHNETPATGESHRDDNPLHHLHHHMDAMPCHSVEQPDPWNLEDVMNLPGYLRRVA